MHRKIPAHIESLSTSAMGKIKSLPRIYLSMSRWAVKHPRNIRQPPTVFQQNRCGPMNSTTPGYLTPRSGIIMYDRHTTAGAIVSFNIIQNGTPTMCSYAMEDCISLQARKNMVVSTILRRGWLAKAKAIFGTADLRLVHVYPKDGEPGRRYGCCQPNPFMAVGPIQGKLIF